MLYICIPAYNERQTIGVLLWRIRKVFEEYPREYTVLVYDDGSTDGTDETLAPYSQVLPLAILGGEPRRGFAAALDALCRAASDKTRFPRRDALILMEGDFTNQPDDLPELIKRFEGGADIVVGERAPSPNAPAPVRLLSRLAPWVTRPSIRFAGITDPFGTYRLFRISVIRSAIADAVKDGVPLATQQGWAANVELLARALKHSRRVETVTLSPRYDLRFRESRVRPLADAVRLGRWGWTARARLATNPRT